MSTAPLYQLIDFGGGKKLERIGGLIVERPHPGALLPPLGSPLWRHPDLIYTQDRWKSLTPKAERLLKEKTFLSNTATKILTDRAHSSGNSAEAWEIAQGNIRLGLRPTPAGQVGIFPEHWAHWAWFQEKLLERSNRLAPDSSGGLPATRVLHLFGYTGATTLALAEMGYHVTHVDASKPTVQWARENCLRSNLGDKPIRWIVEDAAKFVAREVKRENVYDAIILDPPTFGHGTKAERWEIQRDLLPLMENLWRLLSNQPSFVLLCGHSADIRLRDLAEELRSQFGKSAVGRQKIQKAFLASESGGELDCGYACKFEW